MNNTTTCKLENLNTWKLGNLETWKIIEISQVFSKRVWNTDRHSGAATETYTKSDRATIRFIPPLLIFVSHAITIPLVVLPTYRLFQFLSVFSSTSLACFFSWYACTTQHWTKDRLWALKPFQVCSLTKLSNGLCPLHCTWPRLVFCFPNWAFPSIIYFIYFDIFGVACTSFYLESQTILRYT